jgi:hypothetical protein
MMLGDAGSLTSFVVGDVHNLVLVSDNVHRIELFNANKIPSPFATYFCKKVDPFDLPRHKSHNRTPQRTAGAAAERER